MKKVLILLSVVFSVATMAIIGSILPSDYPTPEAVSPQQTVPAAPQAPIPIAPQPGHPGGIYTQVVATCYGSIEFTDEPTVDDASIAASGHKSPDGLSAFISFVADTRDEVTVSFNLTEKRDDVNTVYITVNAPEGVEVNVSSGSVYFYETNNESNSTTLTLADVFHVSPGVWLAKFYKDKYYSPDMDNWNKTNGTSPGHCYQYNRILLTIYGQPIASGDRYITITFTAE